MQQCLQCGFAPLAEKDRHCPNCGAEVPPASPTESGADEDAVAADPGPPVRETGTRLAAGLVTKFPLLDGILGFLTVAALIFLPPALSLLNVLGVPLLLFWTAVPVLYFVLRRRLPAFARGVGFGMLALFLLFLGLLVQCSREGFH